MKIKTLPLILCLFFLVSAMTAAIPRDYQDSLSSAAAHRFNLNQIRSFVYYWYSLHDKHADINRTYELLDKNNLLMKFPETEVRNFDEYKKWYDNVGNNIATNIHIVKQLDVSYLPDHKYEVNLIVNWQAVDKSGKFISFDATQQWILADSKDEALNHPLVQQYIVKNFVPVEYTDAPLVRYQFFNSYSTEEFNRIFSDGIFKSLPEALKKDIESIGKPANAINAYQIEYKSENYDGLTVDVSGIVIIPDVKDASFPLLSYQHGTVLERDKCPSYFEDCAEAELVALIFAAHGYVVCMTDHIGQGKSDIDHPYLHVDTEASSGLDMILATKELCRKLGVKLDSRLFITGYSQGGQAAMALQRLVEEKYPDKIKITASAPASGPYDAVESWEHLIKKPCVLSSAVGSRWALSYNEIYGNNRPLDTIFNPPYDKTVPVLLDGYHNGGETIGDLPHDPAKMFRKDFVEQTLSGTNSFGQELKKNDLSNWCPQSPTRLYANKSDEAVPYYTVDSTYQEMKKLGAKNIEIVAIGEGLPHSEAFVPIMIDMKKWFDSFK